MVYHLNFVLNCLSFFFFAWLLGRTTFSFWNSIFSHVSCKQAELPSNFTNRKAGGRR